MKKIVTLYLILTGFSLLVNAQAFMERYYDEDWNQVPGADIARFYSISKKTDSGWGTKEYYLTVNRIQMIGLFADKEKSIKNGNFYYYYPDGKIKSAGRYENNARTGLWLSFYNDGSLKDSLNYDGGHLKDISMSWYRNGFAKDSVIMHKGGHGVKVSWFDNGNPSEAGIYTEFDKKNGKWKYFHKNGNLSSEEVYDTDILLNKKFYNEDGSPGDTSQGERPASFPGGGKKWSKFISSQLYFPSRLEFQNVAVASVMVTATLNEEGEVIDAEVIVPLHPEFDKIALNAIKKSPKWQPAVSHNRKVYSTIKQTVSYSQSVGY